MHYSVVVHKDKESDYGVIVPDIPGCVSAGNTYEEALLSAREAIECHIEGLLMDGEALPLTTDIELHLNNPNYADGIWGIVEIDLSQLSGKAKRINITLPEKVLTLIDLYTKNHNIKNTSALIADATMSYITRL